MFDQRTRVIARDKLVKCGYIPFDKSWIIRMGILDLVNGYDSIFGFLSAKQAELPDDLLSLQKALTAWREGKPDIDVGESGTLYRFLQFASWRMSLTKNFIRRGTLKDRRVCSDWRIINWPTDRLLTLDGKTSQWASASALLGNTERIWNPPFKLQATYDAIDHWQRQRKAGKAWKARYDLTILRQAVAFLEMLKDGNALFFARQAEDYCFARAFAWISKEQGERFWPSLRNHESDRIEEMDAVINAVENGQTIVSRDHRAVQAGAMLAKFKGADVKFAHPECVCKSWPQFWDFLETA